MSPQKKGIAWYWHLVLFFITGGLWIFYPLVKAMRKHKRNSAVQVAFRELTDLAPTDLGGTYTYRWTLSQKPQIGDRVIVPGGSPAVVVALGAGQGVAGMELKQISRLATDEEISDALNKKYVELERFLASARHEAGLPGGKRPRVADQIPPATGEASKHIADSHGRAWWRIYRTAEEAGADEQTISSFKALAHRWFAIRDRQA